MGAAQSLPMAKTGGDKSWQLKATYVEVCSCFWILAFDADYIA